MPKAKPKTFSGNRPLKNIKAACRARGWQWDQTAFDGGSDFVTFEFRAGRKKFRVLYNTVNGRFTVRDGSTLIMEASTNMDAVRWYAALLDFIYLPKKKARAAA